MEQERQLVLHASAVCFGTRAALIRGASGSGKSALALELMTRGAQLIADDQVILHATPEGIALIAPGAIRGLIEARGVGLLQADAARTALLAVVVDLDQTETDRLPPVRNTVLLGASVPLLHNVAAPYFPAALIQYLRCGRHA
ncbi:HPr kinase/phosphorylase [Puniceibacterium sediminis]|uniref:Hpr(Ser) kinase/phosphatase n=1 Tax=Puniceibacterium sediminis TaxID=1608407 RepID=A0A238WIK1_9RHOB|nr:HPr kinase/phosphatase C-terminal domain-containing protein [Puniceibacterium sediminis]SNR46307.1 Hpr(Ser) kinase/phosphatase [Puniceibacterium sediminis]